MGVDLILPELGLMLTVKFACLKLMLLPNAQRLFPGGSDLALCYCSVAVHGGLGLCLER